MALKNQELGFFKGRLKGGFIALKGAYTFLSTEHSAMVQFSIAVLMSVWGFFLHLSKVEWMFHILAFSMVLALEAANTAIEKLCDFINESYHARIGFIKDVSAGAVTFAAVGALLIELLIFIPKIF